MTRVFLVLFLLCGWFGLNASDEVMLRGDEPVKIPRVTRPPTLDDFLNGTPREAELVIDGLRQFMPGDGEPVSQPTTFYLSYDDENIYIAFICEDDRKLIRARLAKRELIMQDDRVTICIDTFHDHRHMYWFDINPYGVQADGNVTDGVEDDASWDTLWHSNARITGDGYTGIAVIPFKSLRFPSDDAQTWGLIVGRWIMRNNEMSLWPYVTRRLPGYVQQGGDMTGIRGISAGRNIQLIPYGMFSRSRYLDRSALPAPVFRTENEFRGGLDAKLVIKDAFTLDATLNPDFSQVESDEPQVTINQRFEVFFPEKRPFFMENAGYFKTPETLFFSRRIGEPRFGARLTGKAGKWALGALITDDRVPGKIVRDDNPLYGRVAGDAVIRLQRELKGNSNVAVMVTNREFGSTYNRVFSVDTRLQLLRNWILTGQSMSSNSRLEDKRGLAGPAYFLEWAHSGRHLISRTSYVDRSPNFRAALGYFNRVDIREARQTFGYMWRPEGSALVSFGPTVKGLINYDRQGRLQDWEVNPIFLFHLTRMTTISLERSQAYELFENQGFRKHNNAVFFESELLKWLAFEASLTTGTSVNYYPAEGFAPFLGRMTEMSAGFTLHPTPHAKIEESYIYSGLRADKDSGLERGLDDASIYNNHIFRSKVNYQFNRQYSLRVIVDYNSVLPNGALVDLEKTKLVGVDALFTYLLNPGTALHVGYTDLYDNLRYNPTISPNLWRTQFPNLNTGRQAFVKLSYLLRF